MYWMCELLTLPQDKSVKPELEWICNDCIDFISKNYDLDQSTDQYLNSFCLSI